MGSEAVRPIQQALKSQGLESGGIDGIWGATPLPQWSNLSKVAARSPRRWASTVWSSARCFAR